MDPGPPGAGVDNGLGSRRLLGPEPRITGELCLSLRRRDVKNKCMLWAML